MTITLRCRSIFLLIATILVWVSGVRAAEPDSLAREGALRVYLDGFSDDYFKENVTFVNYVRDPDAGDVYVNLSVISAGTGATDYSIEMIGLGRFAGVNDTLHYFSGPTEIDDDVREGILRTLKMGLVRYIARTPAASDIEITCRRKIPPRAIGDRWDSWVIQMGTGGSLSGNQREGDYGLRGSFSASRITEGLKMNFGGFASYKNDETALTARTLHTIYRANGFDGLVVKSLTGHWSAGGFASGDYVTTGNVKTAYTVAPAVEFSVFPYKEANIRAVTFLYRIEYSDVTYHDVTIYDKTAERLWRHALGIQLDMTRPWGSAHASIAWSQYLHDAGINTLSGMVTFSYRLFRGFSIDISGNGTRNHDLIDQPRRSLTDEEILLRLRSLAETYSYSTSVGFSYTFGSIYSNVVNPRF
jgi:hypothetical protein